MDLASGGPPEPPLAVLRGGAVGDFILTLPAIDAFRCLGPGRPLWLVARPAVAALVHPDRVIDLDGPALLPLFSPAPPELGAGPAPLAGVGLTLAYVAGAGEAERKRLEALTGGEVWLADPRPSPGASTHIIDHLLSPLARRGVPIGCRTPRVTVARQAEAWASGNLPGGESEAPLVCLHPGSGGEAKCWPLTCFSRLAGDLVRAGCRPVILMGPAEAERWGSRPGALPASVGVTAPPGLPELAALLARADLYVGNDSGPGHLAAAVGAPVLTLFGPTDPAVWAPRGRRCRALRAPHGDLSRLGLDCVRAAAMEMLAAAGDRPDGA